MKSGCWEWNCLAEGHIHPASCCLLKVPMKSISEGVDGKYLVVSNKTALPQRCIRTNQPISEREYTSWDLPYVQSSLAIFLLLGLWGLFFWPSATTNRCKFKAGLSSKIRLRYLLWKTIAILIMLISPVFLTGYLFIADEFFSMTSFILFPLSLCLGTTLLFLYSSPFKVTRSKDGMFWIKGCSPEFLASLDKSSA